MAKNSTSDAQATASPAQFDDLFDYDVDLDGILQDASTRSNANPSRAGPGPDAPGLGLGLDNEVKVTKTRQPVAKLDESRLLSQAGIPKLRRTSRQKLKFNGKGHEFSDAARLLNFYQLWLDDLFPRAKFSDGLAIIEKLGHSKRIQTMRREWIDEEKPRQHQIAGEEHYQGTKIDSHSEAGDHNLQDMVDVRSEHHPQPAESSGHSDRDGDLFISDKNNAQHSNDEIGPEDDDLEALLREHESDMTPKDDLINVGQTKESVDGEIFADELEAMEELDLLKS